ncbi:MAG: glutamate synthase large subunit [Polyangiaceae bacterium]
MTLYDPAFEHDACGVGFVATLSGAASHSVVENALTVLARMRHRGAAGADPLTGDGAGILLQIPHDFFARHLGYEGKDLPLAGDYGVAQVFLSHDPRRRHIQTRALEETVRYHGQKIIGWRDVPIREEEVGPMGRESMPVFRQLFIGRMAPLATFERTLFTIRKRAGKRADSEGAGDLYIPSCSSHTIVYKGLPLPEKLASFYVDLEDREVKSRLAIVHSRFSTNTNPSWERAHPYRRIAHNGEINTLSGNVRWMSARESRLSTHVFREHLQDFKPIVRPGGSDSASLDNVVDFLVAAGRPISEVMMMLVPEAWESRTDLDPDLRAFYAYHAALTEPWDGPAALVFTDGKRIGACLDRNGLRPLKYVATENGLVVLASELGVLETRPESLVAKGRVRPGELFLVDTEARRIVSDEELKRDACSRKPYREWIAREVTRMSDLAPPSSAPVLPKLPLEQALRLFGTTRDDLRLIIGTMAALGEEPVGSMGNDAPLAVLSDKAVPFFRYFKQQFAQVTNPPIDPIRERLVMSLTTRVGGAPNLLSDELSDTAPILEFDHPILSADELRTLLAHAHTRKIGATLPTLFDATNRNSEEALLAALDELSEAALSAVAQGQTILVLSDRDASATRAPIPPLLATACVHHTLNRAGSRLPGAIVVDTGGAREVADMALLFGYGATLVCPYLAESAARMLAKRGDLALYAEGIEASVAAKNYRKAIEKGLLKVFSKMGISTLESYRGSQLFEAVGVERAVCDRFLTGTVSRLEGVGLHEVAEEVLHHHRAAFSDAPELDVGGVYAYRARGERHLWTPDSVSALQKAVRTSDAPSYARYAELINDQEDFAVTLRGLCGFLPHGPEVPLDEVEPASEIVKRFCTGAMSFGSISKEAHENLAIAMNRIGGKSNTGEGGEDEARLLPMANGDRKRSAIKQVASGRFGVTAAYLVSADEIQIKVAQGAKPGEGGQLPGHKVDAVIARVRHSTAGVTLISPPPHHDIYSIEDLAQLIFDLKSVAPHAKVSVKLVAEAGIGTVAAGVAKAGADGVTVAGHDGGTGASPLSSIQHAGTPWELGLAEVQQVLRKNGLRGRMRLQVDGQLKTGRDVAFAALFGADEFGFATAPLVASGCIMMRKCHLNTCPVGIATQDEALRARFRGEPEHVIRYFFYVAEELRGIMAKLGFRTVREMVGRIECVVPKNGSLRRSETGDAAPRAGEAGWGRHKASLVSFDAILSAGDETGPRANTESRDPVHCGAVEAGVIERALPSIESGARFEDDVVIQNSDRAFGARLSGLIAQKRGSAGLPDDTLVVRATGTAGQSLGAFASRGLTLVVVGDANDYVGKGLSGGILVVRPSAEAAFLPDASGIVGNTVLYGATSGKAFFRGHAGERFAVRNSGATAVVEGVGDHGCEYMTGGIALILGPFGRNFAAGMSGGVAYVLSSALSTYIERSPLADDLVRTALSTEDVRVVEDLLREHHARTGSPLASSLLEEGAVTKGAFEAILSIEYQRIRARISVPKAASDVSHG